MTKQTRYFMAGSAAILAAGLCTGLVAYYGGGFQALSASTGPTELAYVPADASVVAYVDVRSIMDSELRQRLKSVLPGGEEGQREFLRETGINIETDVDYIVTSLSPSAEGDLHGGPLVVVRGRFNPDNLQSLAREHGGLVEEYRGKQLVTSPNNQAHAVAFLEPGLVAVGAASSVKKVDRRHDDRDEHHQQRRDDEPRRRHRPQQQCVGGRSLRPDCRQAKLPEHIARQIPPVKWFAAAGHINGGISALVRAEAKDEQAADNLRDVVRGFLALGRLQSQGDPRIAAVASSMQLEGTGTTVQLTFSVPAEVIELVMPKKPEIAAEPH